MAATEKAEKRDPKKRYAKIIVHNLDMPAGSDIDVGLNGMRNIKIKEGEETVVEEGVFDILHNAVREVPVQNEFGMILGIDGQVLGDRNIPMKTKKMPRFTIQVLRGLQLIPGRKTEEERETIKMKTEARKDNEHEKAFIKEIAEAPAVPLEEQDDNNADNNED